MTDQELVREVKLLLKNAEPPLATILHRFLELVGQNHKDRRAYKREYMRHYMRHYRANHVLKRKE